MRSNLAALGAVVLWGSLAALVAALGSIPPLLITGLGLLLGSLISLPLSCFKVAKLKVGARALSVGVLGLFGYHFALFAGLQNAPSVQANLVNYLWPLLIVVLAPLFLPGTRLTPLQIVAALLGFTGAGLAILSGSDLVSGFAIGYVFAFLAAVIWASYSLLSKRVKFETPAVGVFALVSGLLAIAGHLVFEPSVIISPSDWLLLVALGLGPLGASFYLWDFAIKHGDPQRIGLIAFLTPVISTSLLMVSTGTALSPLLAVSAVIIIFAAYLGSRGAIKGYKRFGKKG